MVLQGPLIMKQMKQICAPNYEKYMKFDNYQGLSQKIIPKKNLFDYYHKEIIPKKNSNLQLTSINTEANYILKRAEESVLLKKANNMYLESYKFFLKNLDIDSILKQNNQLKIFKNCFETLHLDIRLALFDNFVRGTNNISREVLCELNPNLRLFNDNEIKVWSYLDSLKNYTHYNYMNNTNFYIAKCNFFDLFKTITFLENNYKCNFNKIDNLGIIQPCLINQHLAVKYKNKKSVFFSYYYTSRNNDYLKDYYVSRKTYYIPLEGKEFDFIILNHFLSSFQFWFLFSYNIIFNFLCIYLYIIIPMFIKQHKNLIYYLAKLYYRITEAEES